MINWLQYITSNNPRGVVRVLDVYGYEEPHSPEELWDLVNLMVFEHEGSVWDLFKEHPDFDMLHDVFLTQKSQSRNTRGFADGPSLMGSINEYDTHHDLPDPRASDSPRAFDKIRRDIISELDIRELKMTNLKQGQWINIGIFALATFLLVKTLDKS